MAEDTQVRQSYVLSKLALTDFYPQKLTRQDMYKITKESLIDCNPKSLEELGWFYIKKLTQYNYKFRGVNVLESDASTDRGTRRKFKVQSAKKDVFRLHPLDVLIAIFLCCDPVCKQDLVKHMWACRTAVPFVLEHCETIELFLWPLRSVVMQWDEMSESKDTAVVTEPMKAVGFVRFSPSDTSKAALINSIISDSETVHPMFFNRNSYGSSRKSYLKEGMVEIGWYFPGLRGQTFSESLLLINVRGNIHSYPKQREVLETISNVLLIFCSVDDLDKKKNIITDFSEKNIFLIVVITDSPLSVLDVEKVNDIIESYSIQEDAWYITSVHDKQGHELLKELRETIKRGMLHSIPSSLKAKCEALYRQNFQIDEFEEKCMHAKRKTDAFIANISHQQLQNRKSNLLPLQGPDWKHWNEADKELYRLHAKSDSEDLFEYRERLELEKNNCRKRQFQTLTDGIPKHISMFVEGLCLEDTPSRLLFLRWIKIELDHLSQVDFHPLLQKYKREIEKLSTAAPDEKLRIRKALDVLEEKKICSSFGVEHLTREIGQIYEACRSVQFQEGFRYENVGRFPLAAARMIVDGYPFEIMDGDTNAVQTIWVKDVLDCTAALLREEEGSESVRIFALSVIGVQSSGKSTMLNAMFGSQFKVSAGRCTKGIFMQLIKVGEDMRVSLQTDYFVLLDTEGLSSPDLIDGFSRRRDNELSTFVIGLGDMTLINLMGENTKYLEDILPISVHAFLRMDDVGFSPKCSIVHHSVDKSNEEKLLQQSRILEFVLNTLTKQACEFERKEIRTFKEIIEFNSDKDVDYLPVLFEGELPMSPLSARYSEEVCSVKTKILRQKILPKAQPTGTLEEFSFHLTNLYEAIKRENFVYEFRSALETEARAKLDQEWIRISSKLRQEMNRFLSMAFIMISNAGNENELKKVRDKLRESHDLDERACTVYQEEFLVFFSQHSQTKYHVFLESLKPEALRKLRSLGDALNLECEDQIKTMIDDRIRTLAFKEENKQMTKEIDTFILTFIREQKNRRRESILSMTDDEIEDLFERKWKAWMKTMSEKYKRRERQRCRNVRNDFVNELRSLFKSHEQRVLTKIKCLDKVDAKEMEMEIQQKHWMPVQYAGGPNCFDALKNAADKVMSQVENKLLDYDRKQEPYNTAKTNELLLGAKTISDALKPITVTAEFEIDLAVCICARAINRLENLHENFESRSQPEAIMASYKADLYNVFKVHFERVNTTGYVTTCCIEACRKGIQSNIERNLPMYMLEEVKSKGPLSRVVKSKTTLLNNMLLHFALHDDFENLYKYIHWPEQAFKTFLVSLLDKTYCTPDRTEQTGIRRIASAMSLEYVRVARKTFQEAAEKLGEHDVTLTRWKDEVEKLSRDRIVLDLQPVDLIDLRHVNVAVLTEELSKEVTNLERSAEEINDRVQEIDRYHLDLTAEELLKDILGCREKCPFCGEICISAQTGHSGDHETQFHRPLGSMGKADKTGIFLEMKTCSQLVDSEEISGAADAQGNPVAFANYRQVFPRWKIKSEPSLQSNSFWKWFFVSNMANLSRKYDLQLKEVPESWRTLTKEGEIQMLKTFLRM